MEIFFRADASLSIGTGHIVRCSNLADKFRSLGYKCIFITKDHYGNLNDNLLNRGYEPLIITANQNIEYVEKDKEWLGGSQLDDAVETIKLITKKNISPKLIIVDHYSIDSEWEGLIKEKFPKCLIVVIDDLCNRNHISDILIDTTVERNIEDYTGLIPQHCLTLLGTRYSLLKPEFFLLRSSATKKRFATNSPKKLLITMGGVDALNVTSRVLNAINNSFVKDVEQITVVLGTNCPHINTIKAKSLEMHCKTTVLINADNMPELMLNNDASVGALGGTTWERCVLGLPTINMAIAENQKVLINKLQRNGFITINNIDFSDEELNSAWINLKKNYLSLSKKSFELCDGLGMDRVVARIESILKVRGCR